jgi:hypothetical protein
MCSPRCRRRFAIADSMVGAARERARPKGELMRPFTWVTTQARHRSCSRCARKYRVPRVQRSVIQAAVSNETGVSMGRRVLIAVASQKLDAKRPISTGRRVRP